MERKRADGATQDLWRVTAAHKKANTRHANLYPVLRMRARGEEKEVSGTGRAMMGDGKIHRPHIRGAGSRYTV